MGSGNAIRVTEPETFTLIQLEEERQKLKKKELLKSMLTDSEFSIKGQCAINLMMTKLDIINTFLLMKYKRNFIQMKTWRLKSYDSVCKKMQKKGRFYGSQFFTLFHFLLGFSCSVSLIQCRGPILLLQ